MDTQAGDYTLGIHVVADGVRLGTVTLSSMYSEQAEPNGENQNLHAAAYTDIIRENCPNN
jgi:hypothetical protein